MRKADRALKAKGFIQISKQTPDSINTVSNLKNNKKGTRTINRFWVKPTAM